MSNTNNTDDDNNNIMSLLGIGHTHSTNVHKDISQIHSCVPIPAKSMELSKDGRTCQICKYEGRGKVWKDVVYCKKCKIRCCIDKKKYI